MSQHLCKQLKGGIVQDSVISLIDLAESEGRLRVGGGHIVRRDTQGWSIWTNDGRKEWRTEVARTGSPE